jgi:hypothetical protein
LVVEPDIVHVRLYKQKFAHRLREVDPSALSLGTIHDADGFGIGHMPLSRRQFEGWAPVLVRKEVVNESELDGYHEWQQANGGVWGKP